MQVLELMKAHVITTTPGTAIQDTIDLFDLYQVRTLPVVDQEGRVIGVLTESAAAGPLLRAFAATAGGPHDGSATAFEAEVLRTHSATVADAMTAPAVAIDETADVREAARLMLRYRLTRLPVTCEGRLVGMLSRIDVCQALLAGRAQ